MAQNEKSAEGAKKNALMVWFDGMCETYAEHGRLVGGVYSVGAAVVIVGALFKIQHWAGASILLTAGMCTEALLFVMGLFEKPHPTYHWENVFPGVEKEDNPSPLADHISGVAATASAKAADKPAVPALTEKDMENLKGSIADLAKTAGQLSDLGKVATATTKLSEKAEAAAEAADKYAAAANALGEKSAAMVNDFEAAAKNVAGSVEGTKQYQAAVAAVAKNAAQWSADVEAIQASAAATAKEAKAAEAAQAKLAKQIADLNNIYGNMLTAVA